MSSGQRWTEALGEFAEAVRLAPDATRYAYVYAVALNDAGRVPDALKVLRAALKLQPYKRDVLFGLAFYSAEANNRKAALGYVITLRELEPENGDYAQLAARLGAADK